jgi:hypothetical protein
MEGSSRLRICMTRSRVRADSRIILIVALLALTVSACADPDRERLKATTKASYDSASGKLAELTFDANKNGRIDTWTEMDGTRPVRSRIDSNEDGKVDKWEYYDQAGKLLKVGLSRQGGDKPDAWAFAGADGQVERMEVSSTADEARIDRWERYEKGVLTTVEFDENGDGRPDRRLTYRGEELASIETEPDASGKYTRKVEPK